MPPRIKALWLLAWHLLRTLVRRLFGGGKNGLARFKENYAADGLSAVDAEQRAQMATFGRCIACGLCDRGEAGRIVASRGAYNGVMQLIVAASRSMPDYAAAALSFSFVPDDVLAQKEKICPTEVPMRQIARFVREKGREARGSLPVAGSDA